MLVDVDLVINLKRIMERKAKKKSLYFIFFTMFSLQMRTLGCESSVAEVDDSFS